MRAFLMGCASATMLAATSVHGQVTVRAPQVNVVVRGVVFDSLTMSPVANAAVWLPGGTQTTNTDDKGRFELDNVPQGKQFLAFSNPTLDSLGLGTLGTQVQVTGDGLPVRLTTPSFQTVWRALCSGAERASRSDSGIVWGTVRDAVADTRLSGASAGFSWYDMSLGADKRYVFRELTHQTRTDSAGNYYACGLPSDIKISSEATGSKSASGTIEYLIGERRLYRVDLLVSTDMVLQRSLETATSADSQVALRARGTATLRGTVRDNKGKPVSSVIITLASVDTSIRSNDEGMFTLTGLPAGTHALQGKLLGFSPASMLVELRPEQTTNITVDMPSARVLAAVNVRAERASGIDKLAFDDRRRTTSGYALTEKELGGRFDIMSTVMGLPRVERIPGRGTSMIGLRSRRGGVCMPTVYLDGMRVDQEQVNAYQPTDLRAVEVYNGEFNAPLGYDSRGCGVVLFWTKRNPRW